MLDKTMERAINRQIKAEFYSAYLYLAMAAHAEAANLPGFAHWMRVQSQEEIEHGMKFFKYVNERGGRVVLEAIDRPPEEFASALDLFEKNIKANVFAIATNDAMLTCQPSAVKVWAKMVSPVFK